MYYVLPFLKERLKMMKFMYTLDFSAFVGEISIPIEAVLGSEKSFLCKLIS